MISDTVAMIDSIRRTNLALRFLLELAALVAIGYWGWTTHAGGVRFVWTIGGPLLVAAIWGIFRVPGDPGDAPIAVPGPVRLLIEGTLFGLAVGALLAVGLQLVGFLFGGLLLGHYLLDSRRVRRLLRD